MILENLSNEEYHADRDHVSKSWLDHLKRSPAHLKEYLDHGGESTKAMEFGSLFHTYVLEPETFHKKYERKPDLDLRTKQGKELFAEFEKINQGKKFISGDDLATIKAMRESILCHREASRLVKANGKNELSIFSEIFGVKVKARFDKLIDDKIIVDLKTTEDASIIEFGKSVWNYRYHVQAAFYQDVAESVGLKIEKFYFVAIEKKAPYCVAVYEIDEDAVNIGRRELGNKSNFINHARRSTPSPHTVRTSKHFHCLNGH